MQKFRSLLLAALVFAHLSAGCSTTSDQATKDQGSSPEDVVGEVTIPTEDSSEPPMDLVLEDAGSPSTETAEETDDTEDTDDTGPQVQRKQTSLGLGLNGISDWSTQYPFIDLVHQSRWWGPEGTEAFDFDEHGWVRSVGEGQEIILIWHIPGEEFPSPWERFVVTWEGTGELQHTWGTQVLEQGDHRDVVSVPMGSLGAMRLVSTDPSDHIREISVVPEDLLDEHAAGQVFNPLWTERIQPYRAVRFMDWMKTNGSSQSEWPQRPLPTDVSWAAEGVPMEIMVQLANELNADPWFNMPHLATDEYVREFARYVEAHLDPHLIAHVEYSNEVWNWGFPQSHYAYEQALELWGIEGSGWVQYNGMRAARTCDIWKGEVFADAPERVHCVLGVQAGWQDIAVDALDCPEWEEAPCHAHGIDSVSITGYFSGCLHYDDYVDELRTWFDQPDGGHQMGVEQAWDGRHLECSSTVAGLSDTYAWFKALADERDLVVTAYEGGQHITGNGHAIQGDADFVAFHLGINRHELMEEVYTDNFEAWREQGGTLFMHFVDIGAHGQYGSWGALEHLSQQTSPRWEAIEAFNQETCWWEGCSQPQ